MNLQRWADLLWSLLTRRLFHKKYVSKLNWIWSWKADCEKSKVNQRPSKLTQICQVWNNCLSSIVKQLKGLGSSLYRLLHFTHCKTIGTVTYVHKSEACGLCCSLSTSRWGTSQCWGPTWRRSSHPTPSPYSGSSSPSSLPGIGAHHRINSCSRGIGKSSLIYRR